MSVIMIVPSAVSASLNDVRDMLGGGSSRERVDTPPQAMPPLPDGTPQETPDLAAPQQNKSQQRDAYYGANEYQKRNKDFPPLPPSRPCAFSDILGDWKLSNVYEYPAGPEMHDFAARPHQYLQFYQESTYGKYSDPNARKLGPEGVRREIKKDQQGLHQFVVAESGVIYFYNQGVAADSRACFIVANAKEPYVVGSMLLMPPAGQQSARLVKVYIRHVPESAPPPRAGNRPPYLPAVSHTGATPNVNRRVPSTSVNRPAPNTAPAKVKTEKNATKNTKQKRQYHDSKN
jgi:hypothetical protein